MLNWVRSIDWVSIGASALLLAIALLVTPKQHQAVSAPYREPCQISSPSTADERIADYTFGLETFTGLLAFVSLFQIYFLFRTDRTASDMAEVARRQMLISGAQTDIQEKQKEIARQEFLVTHRPQLEVRFVREVSDGIEITVINTGTGTARFVAARGAIWHVLAGEKFPSPHDLTESMNFSLRDTFEPSGADRHTISDTADSFSAGFGGPAHIFGWIIYDTEGPSPVRRTTFFGRRVETLEPELVQVKGTDWNFIQ